MNKGNSAKGVRRIKFQNTDHDYYCANENYLKRDMLQVYNTWSEFKETCFFSLEASNLLFRYDIGDFHYKGLEYKTLKLYFVLQRKAFFVPAHVYIREEDMIEVEEFLKARFEYLKSIWGL